MLTLLLGKDWIAVREQILNRIGLDVASRQGGRILIVPELISHDMERRLCAAAGDSCSRFAEVLSFSRLVRRVAEADEIGQEECLDNGGRVAAMAASVRQLHSKLKAYSSVETKPEFLMHLVDAVDEFKRCCISSKDLMEASRRSEGSLAQKLEELSLILEAYDSICQNGKRDPRDQMSWLLEQMEEDNFAGEHVFYIDGFPDFTRQNLAVISHLIRESPHVTIGLNCDEPGSRNASFETAGNTASELIKLAQQAGVAYRIENIHPLDNPLQYVTDRLFYGTIQERSQLQNRLNLYKCKSINDECIAAADRIRTLVQQGARYRDICIVTTDMGAYKNTINQVFSSFSIPVYQSGTEDILEKSVITTVLAAMEAALNGFEQRDVLRYLKSMLSPLTLAECDKLENYVLLWSINGNRWLKDWEYHPSGLVEKWTDHDIRNLEGLNRVRRLAIEPLKQLADGFSNAVNLQQMVNALLQFLERIGLENRLTALAQQMEQNGDLRNAQILNQLWEILLDALEQMHDLLGETGWDAETFTRLLKLILGQYDVGTIPTVLDAVMVGPVSAMRCQQTEHLIVLGAVEGALPGYGGSVGVLTDQDRIALRKLGVPLTGGAMEGVRAEFSEIYGVFCGARNSICVSYPGGQPSFIYRRLLSIVGVEHAFAADIGVAASNADTAGAYFVRNNDLESADKIGLANVYESILNKTEYSLGSVSCQTVEKLYGTQLNLSASQVDKLGDCRLAYFLKYGMRAQERKPVSVDPAEFGTYVHAVLEETAAWVMEQGGFKMVSLEDTLTAARHYSQAYSQEHFSQLESERMTYLLNRNIQELEMIVTELWEELSQSSFAPVGFEVAFGDGGQMDAISISGSNMSARLRGFVDRVDAWQAEGQNYFRVVDYKTGKKDFDYCDVFNGLGLQMLLYLFALEDAGQALLGDSPVPAGVQYFPARAPLVTSDGMLSDEEAAGERAKIWKRRGLLLSDEEVLAAMEPCDNPRRMNYTRKKDGTISGDLADRGQLQLLKEYVFHILEKMVDEVASGNVEANPYTRGNSHNACAFCPYGSICHPDQVNGRRNYKKMTSQRFWEEIGKELKDRG